MDQDILKQEAENEQLQDRLKNQEQKLAELKDDYDKELQTYMKEKEEPGRLAKGNANIKNGVQNLKTDLEKLTAEKNHLSQMFTKEEESLNSIITKVVHTQQEIQGKTQKMHEYESEKRENEKDQKILQDDINKLTEDNKRLEVDIQSQKQTMKNTDGRVKNITKNIHKENKEFKQEEHLDLGIQDMNKELLNKIEGTEKLIEE